MVTTKYPKVKIARDAFPKPLSVVLNQEKMKKHNPRNKNPNPNLTTPLGSIFLLAIQIQIKPKRGANAITNKELAELLI